MADLQAKCTEVNQGTSKLSLGQSNTSQNKMRFKHAAKAGLPS